MTTRTLYTLRYNPYMNRQKKGFTYISQYDPYIVGTFTNINWVPNDGVDTVQYLNLSGTEQAGYECDYLIVTDTVNGVETIESRWFVMEASRERSGQYKLSLHRDVIWDAHEIFLNCTAYVEKGWVNTSDIAIYNTEQIQVNQIKQSEDLLKDETGVPWIVGYITKTNQDIECSWNGYGGGDRLTQEQWDLLSSSDDVIQSDWDNPESTQILFPSDNINYSQAINVDFYDDTTYDIYGRYLDKAAPVTGFWEYRHVGSYMNDAIQVGKNFKTAITGNYGSAFKSTFSNVIKTMDSHNPNPDPKLLPSLMAYSGKIVLPPAGVSNDRYRVVVEYLGLGAAATYGYGLGPYTDANIASFRNAMRSIFGNNSQYISGDVSNNPVYINYRLRRYKIRLELYSGSGLNVTIPVDRKFLQNQPYSMFTMPFESTYYRDLNGVLQATNANYNLQIAQAISEGLKGSGALIDLQVVPYCPLRNYLSSTQIGSVVDMQKFPSNLYYTPYYNQSTTPPTLYGYVFWCESADFTFDISKTLSVPSNELEFKVANQATFYRINSPNYSGSFEFTATKNKGVTKFNVDCTYKPYSPYIHVNPNFKALYGQDFNDARGLICAGDFSLPQTTEQWATFQINNKNYQNSFNREVESIELNNKYAHEQDYLNAITGVFSAAVSGGAAGSLMGGAVGGVIGSTVGVIASGAAGKHDMEINQKLREEQLDLKKDLYNYSLENIQARPNTLSNVGALNSNNKLFPFLETYSCTDQEKDIIRDKIRYNGMSIYRIGSPSTFLNGNNSTFIKGSIIRMDLNDDYHMLKTIKEEFETGFFYETEVS